MRSEQRAACLSCGHFNPEPAAIESAFPGLLSLSSGYAAVRLNDGLCALHDRYVAASSLCNHHALATGGQVPA
jgi:hypothetical protein